MQQSICVVHKIIQDAAVTRPNQELIAIRLDPALIAAMDRKRATKRQSRSEFIREAIFDLCADPGLSREVIYPQDRVGQAKGGRPKALPLKSLEGTGGEKSMAG